MCCGVAGMEHSQLDVRGGPGQRSSCLLLRDASRMQGRARAPRQLSDGPTPSGIDWPTPLCLCRLWIRGISGGPLYQRRCSQIRSENDVANLVKRSQFIMVEDDSFGSGMGPGVHLYELFAQFHGARFGGGRGPSGFRILIVRWRGLPR